MHLINAEFPNFTRSLHARIPALSGDPRSRNGLANSELDLTFQATQNPEKASHTGFKLGTQPDGSDLTKSSIMKLNVQDQNGTVLSDDYTVNWHLPYEGVEPTTTKLNADHQLHSPDSFDNAEVAYQNGTLTTGEFRVGRFAWIGDVAEGAAPVLELLSAFSFKNPAVSPILTAVGLGLSEIDPTEELITAVPNNPKAWNEAVRLNLIPSNATVDNWDDCKMVYPHISVWYNEHHYIGDAYDLNGFVGRKRKVKKVRRKDDAVVYTGRYDWTKPKPLQGEEE